MKRGYALLSVVIAFLGGFMAAILFQVFIWNKGIQFSIAINLAKPSNPTSTSASSSAKAALTFPPGPEQEKAQATVPETHPHQEQKASETMVQEGEDPTKIIAQHYPGQEKPSLDGTIQADPDISSEDVIRLGQVLTLPQPDAPGQDEAVGGQAQQVEPPIERTKPSLGFQGNKPVMPEVASFQESLPGVRPEANKGPPEGTSRSSEVAGTVLKEASEPAKTALSLPPKCESEQAQVEASETNLLQERLASKTPTIPDTAPELPFSEAIAAGAPFAQVVVQKGENLTKIIDQHYPGQEDLGLQATILANPEINSENIIHAGQMLSLPQIDVSEQIIHLHDERLYAPYGSYYSAASWEKDKSWLEENQVRFLVRVYRESTGRVIHRVFLGGYETAKDLKQAQDRLTKKDRAQVEINSETPGGSASTAGQEEILSGSHPTEAASNSDSPAPALENQPDLSPSAPAGGIEGKGETRLQEEKMTVVQYFPKGWLDGRPIPLVQFSTLQQAAAYVDLIVCRYRNIFESLLLPISRPESRQATSAKIILTGNNIGDPTGVRQTAISAVRDDSKQSEPFPEDWFRSSPSLSRYIEILDVFLINIPESPWKSFFPGELSQVKTDARPNTCEIQDKEAKAGPQDLQSKDEPREQEPPGSLPGPGPQEEALPTGIMRRCGDAQSVLCTVNGEIVRPNSGTEIIPVEDLKRAQLEEREEPQDLFPAREVSWPGRGQYPLAPLGSNTLKQISPHPGEGIVRRYRDARGVLHIDNAGPKDQIPTTATIPAENKERTNRDPNSLVKNVSFSVEQSSSTPISSPLKRTLPSPGKGNIRCFRSAKGIIQITNVGSEGITAEQGPKLSLPDRMQREIETVGNCGFNLPPLEKVSSPMRTEPLKAPNKKVPPPKGELLEASTIRRYRDARGVLHIETVENPNPELLSAHNILARFKNLPSLGGGLPASPTPAKSGQGLPRLATSKVLAFRDRSGRLIIHNREIEKVDGVHSKRAMAKLVPIIQEASRLYGLPVPLILALIKVESNFVSRAVSPKGAMGLMQLMPGTAAFLGVQDPFNPKENINGGCRYLRRMVDHFGGSLPLALAAYNAGPQRVVSCGLQIPAIEETQKFVTEVLVRYYLLTKGTRSYGS